MKESEAIRMLVKAETQKAPVSHDPKFSAVRDGKVGLPVMVNEPEGKPAFWLVPILMGDSACGFARVELAHKVSQIGIFGSGPEERASWIDASFFEKPPPEILAEIRTRYSGSMISEPLLSYDKTPARWAWKIEIRNRTNSVAFISPGGWYERKLDEDVSTREG